MNATSPITRNPVILVVDDVEANRTVVCRRLENSGYDLHAVDSGEKALQFIQSRKPDLVLLDFMMPNMNGIDVLNVVRTTWNIPDLPIIMLTARAEADAVVTALEAGADDYVSKPIDFDVLKARIETQLQKLKSSDRLRQVNAALDERVAMRVLAFDELRDELEKEILQRTELQARVNELESDAVTGGVSSDIARDLERAEQILDTVLKAASAGKPVNLALLSSVKAMLGSLRAR